MFQNKSIRWTVAGIVIVLHVVALSYWLGWFKDMAISEIDPPKQQYDTAISDLTDEQIDNTTDGNSDVTLTVYVLDQDGMVSPVEISLPATEGLAKQALQFLMEDGPASGVLPEGFSGVIPKGTKINGINIIQEQKLAVVDFSKEFKGYNKAKERQLVESLTWTLTQFPTIEQVQFQVNGHVLNEMPLAGMPLDSPVTRKIGINLENWDGVRLSEAQPVTLYFTKHTVDHESYFVPVTRLIKSTDQLAATMLEELMKGPRSGTQLKSVFSQASSILELKQSKDEIIVNFAQNDSEDLVSDTVDAVTLSLKENLGVNKVQILVNGKKHGESR